MENNLEQGLMTLRNTRSCAVGMLQIRQAIVGRKSSLHFQFTGLSARHDRKSNKCTKNVLFHGRRKP